MGSSGPCESALYRPAPFGGKGVARFPLSRPLVTPYNPDSRRKDRRLRALKWSLLGNGKDGKHDADRCRFGGATPS